MESKMEEITYSEKIKFIDKSDFKLNDWECNFIESVFDKKDNDLSDKQKQIYVYKKK